ncbi:hypothetical protein K1719_023920 [Acacia pycnantha]|nr:hypothetical protein K1719_023920 [Acacia pycnantha]
MQIPHEPQSPPVQTEPSIRVQQNAALRQYHLPSQPNPSSPTYSFLLAINAQTWLSTALTNIETCWSSALQLNVAEFTAQSNVTSNVRKMISNFLAVNGKFLKQENFTEEEIKAHWFPNWFSGHDRRLLSSRRSSVMANLVVAQDGTGHFKTVQAANDVASVTSPIFM